MDERELEDQAEHDDRQRMRVELDALRPVARALVLLDEAPPPGWDGNDVVVLNAKRCLRALDPTLRARLLEGP
jgi:hypothetical protein